MIDFNFKYYETYNVTNILNQLTDLDWNEFTFRQKTFDSHSETLTIPILWDNEKTQLKYWKDYNNFKNDLDSIGDILTTKIGIQGIKYSKNNPLIKVTNNLNQMINNILLFSKLKIKNNLKYISDDYSMEKNAYLLFTKINNFLNARKYT